MTANVNVSDMQLTKQQYLKDTIKHIDIKKHDPRPILDGMSCMAFQARNLYRACIIYEKMLRDKDSTNILCLSGSLVSAGLKQVIIDMILNNMVDVVVSTGANIVDQDFYEALGFKHYIGSPFVDDNLLRTMHIDRIYDTFIDEDQLRVCDNTITEIANSLIPPRPYSSREFVMEMGKYLADNDSLPKGDSIVLAAYNKKIPIFIPAFSDSSAGFGLIKHQYDKDNNSATGPPLSIDSAKDFLELTKIKIASKETGILIIGGGVPKNFTQDVVVAADILGHAVPMHKYAVQLTVADERDGALSGSTLKEACSWGKVLNTYEQMVYGEATITFPLLIGYAYHNRSWATREEKRLNNLFE
jgi:deoxyhypusine synthase